MGRILARGGSHSWKVSVAGGLPIELARTDTPIAAVWGTDDEIVIQTGDPTGELWSIPPAEVSQSE